MRMKKFFSAVVACCALGYGMVASAAFTGGTTVLVSGGGNIEFGGQNAGFDFGFFPFVILQQPLPGSTGPLTSDAGAVDFTGATSFANLDLSPLLLDPASNALDGFVMLTAGDVSLTFESLIAIVPTTGDLDGSVDYAGLGTLSNTSGESTEVFWHYNVNGNAVGINIDAAGQGSNGFGQFSGSAAVPVPGAIWLFASAAAGLAGVRRLKQ